MAESEGVTHASGVKSCCNEIHQSGYALFLDLVSHTTFRITSGCLAATRSDTRAAPSGFRLPCSQLRRVATLIPIRLANYLGTIHSAPGWSGHPDQRTRKHERASSFRAESHPPVVDSGQALRIILFSSILLIKILLRALRCWYSDFLGVSSCLRVFVVLVPQR